MEEKMAFAARFVHRLYYLWVCVVTSQEVSITLFKFWTMTQE